MIGELGLHAAVVMEVLARIETIAGRADDDDAMADEVACVVDALRRRMEALIERTRRGASSAPTRAAAGNAKAPA